MISNISIHPKTMFKNALNIQDFSLKVILVQPLLAQMVLENQRLSTLF